MVNKHYILRIPTKTYLRKYLQVLYGDPLVFTTINYFGMCLVGFMDKKYYSHKNKELTYRKFDKFTDELSVYFPKDWPHRNKDGFGWSLSPYNVILVNKLFEARFEEDLCRFCTVFAAAGVETKLAIEEFCRLHDISIEEDISFEAIIKKEYRHRKKILKDSSPQLSGKKLEIPSQVSIYPIW